MHPDSSPGKLLEAVQDVLRRWGDRWYVFGAQAVTVWGAPRLTADVDITARLEPENTVAFCAEMKAAGFELRVSDADDFVARTRVLPFLHVPTGLPLDLVLAGSGLEDQFLERARPVELDGVTVPVISPEDLVVAKILAGRPKDVDDVRGILRMRGRDLDKRRIRELLALLEEALSMSGLIEIFDIEDRRASGG